MTQTELAWLAGWLEGEGCFELAEGRYPRVTGTTTDRDIAERARSYAGGSIYECQRDNGRKLRYDWRIAKRAEAEALMRELLPWMGDRRAAKIMEILDYAEANPPKLVRKGALTT